MKLSFDDIEIEHKILKIDSRAPGLEDGQERFVEVDIDAKLEKYMHWIMRAMMIEFRGQHWLKVDGRQWP